MSTYVLMTLWMVFFAYASKKNKLNSSFFIDRKKLVIRKSYVKCVFLFVVSAIAPFAVAALRYDVGTDYFGYLSKYVPHVIYGQFSYISIEPLFAWIIKVAHSWGDYQWMFVFIHFLIVFFIYIAIFKQSPDVVMSVLLISITGFYNFSLNIMRQSIAVSIFVFAIQYIVKKQPIRYTICIVFAAMFHKIAWIFLPVYFFSLNRVQFKEKFIWLLSAFALRAISTPIRNLIVYLFSKFNFFSSYFGSSYDISSNNYMYFLVNIAITALAIYLDHSGDTSYLEENKIKIKVFFGIQYITLVLSALAAVIPNCNRTISIFSTAQIIYLPILFRGIRKPKTRLLISSAFVLGYLIVTYKMYVVGNAGATIPYQSILSK